MQQNSKRLFKYVGKQQKLIGYGVLATLLMSLIELFTGAMFKFLTNVVDDFSGTFSKGIEEGAKLPLKFHIKSPFTDAKWTLINKKLSGSDEVFNALLILCAIFIGLYALLALFNYLRRVFMNAATQRILQNFKGDIYSKILRLPISFFSRNNTGDVVSRVTYDVATLNEIIDLLIEVARAGIYIIVFIPFMFAMSWQLSLLTILYFPLSVVLIDFITRKIKRVSKSITNNVGDYTGFLEEKINRFKLIKIYGKEKDEEAKFSSLIEDNYKYNLKLIKLKFALNPASDLLSVVLLSLVYVYYSFKISHGGTSLGDIVFFVYLVRTAYKPVKKVAQAWGQLHVALVSTQRIFKLLDEVEEDQKTDNSKTESFSEINTVEFKDISFKYPDTDQWVLSKVSFKAMKGDVVGVMGNTGVGKTTLLNLVPKFYEPNEGEVLVNGRNDLSIATLRKNIVYLGANSLLSNGTIRENIEYSGSKISKENESIFSALIGLQNSNELDRQIGKDGIKLSDGQKQKVAFLRSIVSVPKVLILDEVFSSIDKRDISTFFDLCKHVDIVFVVSRKAEVLEFTNKQFEL